LIVIIVGFAVSGNAENNVQEAIYVAIGCLGLVGMAIVLSLPKAPEVTKPAAPTKSTFSNADV